MLQKKLVTIAGKSTDQQGRFFTSKPFDPRIHAEISRFYARDDSSMALPGKRDAKRVKKVQIQKRSLNDYLSNLYLKLKAQHVKTLVFDFCKNATIELCSGKHYESAIRSVHETPKRHPKTKNVERLRQNCSNQSCCIYQNIFFWRYQKSS